MSGGVGHVTWYSFSGVNLSSGGISDNINTSTSVNMTLSKCNNVNGLPAQLIVAKYHGGAIHKYHYIVAAIHLACIDSGLLTSKHGQLLPISWATHNIIDIDYIDKDNNEYLLRTRPQEDNTLVVELLNKKTLKIAAAAFNIDHEVGDITGNPEDFLLNPESLMKKCKNDLLDSMVPAIQQPVQRCPNCHPPPPGFGPLDANAANVPEVAPAPGPPQLQQIIYNPMNVGPVNVGANDVFPGMNVPGGGMLFDPFQGNNRRLPHPRYDPILPHAPANIYGPDNDHFRVPQGNDPLRAGPNVIVNPRAYALHRPPGPRGMGGFPGGPGRLGGFDDII